MRILLDTNIVVNFLTRRNDQFSLESIAIMNMCSNKILEGFIAFHSLSTICYVFRKIPFEMRIHWLKIICSILKIASADNQTILNAIQNSDFKDIEDNLQDCCAQSVHSDYIVTANVRDYEGHSAVKAITPAELLALLDASEEASSTMEVHEPPVNYELAPGSITRYLIQRNQSTPKVHTHRILAQGHHTLTATRQM